MSIKRCQICGVVFDPSIEDEWDCLVARRHIPTDRMGVVYVLHFEEPTVLRQADVQHAVTHYVGWTGQVPPMKRVRQHGPKLDRSVVSFTDGTAEDEYRLKREGQCERCGRSLDYQHSP